MNRKLLCVAALMAVLISACGSAATPDGESTPDVSAVRTSAASTVVSQFTLTAAAFTPTPSEPAETSAPQGSATTGPAASATGPATTSTAPFAQVTDASGTVIALCDSLEFVADVTVPDGTNMAPGQDFLKTWRVKNTGSCPWETGYELIYAGYADEMNGQAQPLTQVVQPGQEVELSVQFQAPDDIGEYLSAWQMSNPRGVTFPEAIYVKVIVQ